MSTVNVAPKDVKESLAKHVLADGYDMTLDMEKSQGVYLHDSKYGRDMLDFFTCFASMPIGYNHPKMTGDKAFQKDLMLAAMTNPSNSDIYTTQYADFVETFARVGIPDYLPHAFFVAGGGLAIENALKVAMDWKVQKNYAAGHTKEKGHKVIHFEQAFHGRTGYTLSLTNTLPEKTKWFAKFDWPRVSNPHIKFPYTDASYEDLKKREELCFSQIENAFKENPDDICAILIEPVQSEGGDFHFRNEFFEKLRAICDEKDCLLIYDEVQTGVALSGKFWLHEHFGENARPDIIAFGKKMQVCGILAGGKVDEVETNCFNVSSRINSTWGGNLVDMVRSKRILEIIAEDDLVEHAAKMGEYLNDHLVGLSEKFPAVTSVRHKGLVAAFDLPTGEARDAIISKGMEMNVMFLGSGDKTIRFRPSLIIQKEDIDKGMVVLATILKGM
ncbi:MAG: L-lysine 6-transaminase [Sphingobacteriales bacterium]|jgi:L-lysine 6-transaminase